MKVSEFLRRVEALFPPHLAESWDNVGLLVGDPQAPVRAAMVCLEATAPTVAEARRRGADLILAHHPLVFRPMKRVRTDDPTGALVAELLRANISLVAAHTNMDAAPWGTNRVLAELLGLAVEGPLVRAELDPAARSRDLKLVVFVPVGSEGAIVEAIDRGGGGRIGLYSRCTFRMRGTGTFLGGEGTNPAIGEAGRFEEADEFRLEAVVPRAARARVLAEVLAAHPYEEPAYDFVPIEGEPGEAGLGCVARLPAPLGVADFAREAKAKLGAPCVRISGPTEREIRRVAICTGSGGSLLEAARRSGADAFLTGETKYHEGIEAHRLGFPVVEVGHYESEVVVAKPLAERLASDPRVREAGIEVFAAESDLQPFVYV